MGLFTVRDNILPKTAILLTWEEMTLLSIDRVEVVGGLSITVHQHHSLGDLVHTAEPKEGETSPTGRLRPTPMLRLLEQRWDEAVAQLLDCFCRDHPVLQEPVRTVDLEREHEAEIRYAGACEHISVALGVVPLFQRIIFLPVYAHYGRDLDEVAKGRRRKGLLDMGWHRVPTPHLSLYGDSESVIREFSTGGLHRRTPAVLLLLPLLALLFHRLEL